MWGGSFRTACLCNLLYTQHSEKLIFKYRLNAEIILDLVAPLVHAQTVCCRGSSHHYYVSGNFSVFFTFWLYVSDSLASSLVTYIVVQHSQNRMIQHTKIGCELRGGSRGGALEAEALLILGNMLKSIMNFGTLAQYIKKNENFQLEWG